MKPGYKHYLKVAVEICMIHCCCLASSQHNVVFPFSIFKVKDMVNYFEKGVKPFSAFFQKISPVRQIIKEYKRSNEL